MPRNSLSSSSGTAGNQNPSRWLRIDPGVVASIGNPEQTPFTRATLEQAYDTMMHESFYGPPHSNAQKELPKIDVTKPIEENIEYVCTLLDRNSYFEIPENSFRAMSMDAYVQGTILKFVTNTFPVYNHVEMKNAYLNWKSYVDNTTLAAMYVQIKYGFAKESIIEMGTLVSIINSWQCENCGKREINTVDSHGNFENTPVIVKGINGEPNKTCAQCIANNPTCTLCDTVTLFSNGYWIVDNSQDIESLISSFELNYSIPRQFLGSFIEPIQFPSIVCGRCTKKEAIRLSRLPEVQQEIQNIEAERRAARGEFNTRNYKSGAKIASEETGEIVTSPRLWGAEIEHYMGNQRAEVIKVYNSMPKEFGCTGDGSLNNHPLGYEIQTCPLGGKKGEETIQSLLQSLSNAGAFIDKSCGTHIHIDGYAEVLGTGSKARTLENLKKIMCFYLTFEDTLASFLPHTRRGGRYCKTLSEKYTIGKLEGLSSVDAFLCFWYQTSSPSHARDQVGQGRYQETRYYGVNLHSLISRGHLEIRHHSGTLNPRKLLEWVNLHTRIVDYCFSSSHTFEEINKIHKDFSFSTSKKDVLYDLLKLSDESKEYFNTRYEKFRIRKKALFGGSDKADIDFEEDFKIQPLKNVTSEHVCVA